MLLKQLWYDFNKGSLSPANVIEIELISKQRPLAPVYGSYKKHIYLKALDFNLLGIDGLSIVMLAMMEHIAPTYISVRE